jgi:hypothetical protein
VSIIFDSSGLSLIKLVVSLNRSKSIALFLFGSMRSSSSFFWSSFFEFLVLFEQTIGIIVAKVGSEKELAKKLKIID